MKQTAVEQFEAHLIEYGFDLSLHKFEIQTFKEMEKEQIIDAHNNGKSILPPNENGEHYYNETFKPE
jgi:hypothetical protein